MIGFFYKFRKYFVFISIYLPIYLSIYLYIYISISIYLSIYLYIYILYIYIYIYIFLTIIRTKIKGLGASKRQIPRLGSIYCHSQEKFIGNCWNCVDYKLNMTSNVFFDMVISQLDSDLTATVKNECWTI